jgi:hypothetical protein
VESAKENFLVAADLGSSNAMIEYSAWFAEDDPQRYVWLARAAAEGRPAPALEEMINQARRFERGHGHAKVVFAIGQALNGQVNNKEKNSL